MTTKPHSVSYQQCASTDSFALAID